jgi:hypothetical protein
MTEGEVRGKGERGTEEMTGKGEARKECRVRSIVRPASRDRELLFTVLVSGTGLWNIRVR